MRINAYVALATGMSRRSADTVIKSGRVKVNGHPASIGHAVQAQSTVTLDNTRLSLPDNTTTIVLNKPLGYVTSRAGQGNKTIYELLPKKFHHLKPVGRLDKDSSGLLLLTNDGQLANQLTHPSYAKEKIYEISLDKVLAPSDKAFLERGIKLKDGLSKLKLQGQGSHWTVTISEGRNRQIRRTFAALDYKVVKLHRTSFGYYQLGRLKEGKWQYL